MLIGKNGVEVPVDPYRIEDAYSIKCPQLRHMLKKVLASGDRGHKSERQDLIDLIDSAKDALVMYDQKQALLK